MSPGLRLWRAHGLGNDYLVVDAGPPLDPPLVRAICDRHRGVGGDGILEPADPHGADHGVRIWNPDGSVAEKSGNGLRIFARYLVSERAAPRHFTVWTGTDRVRCEVDDAEITVEMGAATLEPARVPVTALAPVIDEPWDIDGTTVVLTALATGNPHAVSFWDDALDELPWRALGPKIEAHPRFPNRTNVQFARIVGPRAVEIRIWERGAGPTLASGSSSCATAAAAVLTGRLPAGPIAVHMPGGTLRVTVSDGLALTLAGPVETIGRIEVDAAWLRARLPR